MLAGAKALPDAELIQINGKGIDNFGLQTSFQHTYPFGLAIYVIHQLQLSGPPVKVGQK